MKKILIITADKCDDSELLYPLYRIIEAGMNPVIASFAKGEIQAKYHFKTESEIAVSDICVSDYDGLILPGGLAPEKLRQNEYVIECVRQFYGNKKPMAAICHGQQILISAGILEGKNATCYPGIKDDIINSGAIYEDKCVVVCGNLVTSCRPEDLPHFMREFLKLVNNKN